MSKYSFSVITPFHNVDMEMFENAARHMEQQTVGFENIEWVIVCHNCDEEHLKAVRERVGSYDNVLIKELTNKIYTPSSPRNYGLDFVTADYVGFLDGDDNFRLDAVEKILAAFENSKAQMVVYRREFTLQHQGMTAISETVNWNQTYDQIVISKDGAQDNRTYNDFPFFITSRAYEREFLNRHNIRFDETITISEDCYFNLEVTRYADRICYCPQLIGYNYFINEASMLSAPKSDAEILTMIDSAVKIVERTFNYGIYPNVIIKSLCFVLCRYAMDPRVSFDVKLKIKENLEGYLNTTVPIPEGRFTEPLNTLLNTLPQQVFAGITQKDTSAAAFDDVPVLMQILANNKDTDYGKRYLFADIVAERGYQVQVPISTYETYAPLIDLQIRIGEKNILTATPVKCYAKNRAGRYLPVTQEQYVEYTRAFTKTLKGKNVFFWYENVDTSEVFNDGISANNVIKMGLAGYMDSYRYNGEEQPVEFTSPDFVYFLRSSKPEDVEYINILLALANREVDQLICTFASETGLLFASMKENMERLCSDLERGEVNSEIALSAAQRKLLRAYLRPDKERAEEVHRILSESSVEEMGVKLWPMLQNVTCVATGMQAKFEKNIKKYFGTVSHSNGSLSSFAGVFGEAIGETNQYELVTGTNYYEFLEKGKEESRPVFRSGLEAGKEYTMIVTTPSGLYRYNTEICIRIAEADEGKTIFTIA